MTEQIVPTLESFYRVLASLMLAEIEFAFTNLHLRCAEHVVRLLVAAEVFLKLEGPMALVAFISLLRHSAISAKLSEEYPKSRARTCEQHYDYCT